MIRSKNASGTSRNGHTELKTPIRFLWAGHALVITRIDRLARSMRDHKDIMREPHEKGVHLKPTDQPVDTGSAAGKAFLEMCVRRVRTTSNVSASGRASSPAKANGVYKGRPRSMNAVEVRRLLDESLDCQAPKDWQSICLSP